MIKLKKYINKNTIYFFLTIFIIMTIDVLGKRYIGSSGRSSIRLSFSPKSWQEIFDVIYKIFIGSTGITIMLFIGLIR